MIDRKMPTKKQIFSFWTNNQEGIKIVKKWKKILIENDKGDFEIHEDFDVQYFQDNRTYNTSIFQQFHDSRSIKKIDSIVFQDQE